MTTCRYINKTPHTVTVMHPDGSGVDSYPPDDKRNPCRLTEELDGEDEYGHPLLRIVSVEGLDEPRDGVQYIVSKYVALYLAEMRGDLVFPDGLMKDRDGAVFACTGLAKYL